MIFSILKNNEEFPKDNLLRLCILLMHLIEYYFKIIWNLICNISNNDIYDQCILIV